MATSPGQSPKVQIDVTANTQDAVNKIAQVGDAAEGMADKIETVTTKSGRTFERITTGAGRAAAAADRATRTIVASIKRAQAAEEAGGRDQPDYYLNLAKQRGANINVIEQEVQKLKALREANLAANSAVGAGVSRLNEYGMTAKQTAAAMRQVPAQLTDIVVSLQGGQAPLTVLLQQGGQLRDIFGGIGPAVRAFSNTLIGLINPLTVVIASIGGLAYAYNKGSEELEAFNKTLILSGNILGITGQQLQEIANDIGRSGSGITESKAAETLNKIAESGAIGAENFKKFAEAAINFEKAGGAAAEKTIEAFSNLGKEPLNASIKLNESVNYLTRSTYEQIKALEEQGRFTDAARVAQEAYSDAIETRTPQLVKNAGYVERAWEGVKNAAKSALDQILEIGRSNPLQSLEQQLAFAYQTTPDAENDPGIRNLEMRYAKLKNIIDAERERAKTEAESQSRTNAGIRLSELASNSDAKLAAQRKKVAEATDLFSKATAGLNKESKEYRKIEADYLKTVSAITAETKTGSARTKTSSIDESKRYLDNLTRQLEAMDKLSTVDALTRDIQLGRLGKVNEAQKKQLYNTASLIDLGLEMQEIEKEFAQLDKEYAKQQEERQKAEIKFLEQKSAMEFSLFTQQRSYQRELAVLGAGKSARSLAAGINQINDTYENQRQGIAGELRRGQLTPEDYKRQLDLINETNAKATESYKNHYAAIEQAQKNWIIGATESLNNYYEDSQKIADDIDSAFNSAFKGMEDALVEFVTTGKLSFTDLANSIVADITRIIIKQQILGPLSQSIGGTIGGDNFFANTMSSIFGGGKASGGTVSAGKMYAVNENGPELLTVGNSTMLMMGNQSGYVTPNDKIGGGMTVNITVPMPATGQRATALQFGRDVARQLSIANARNG